jgi:hypothetical protein
VYDDLSYVYSTLTNDSTLIGLVGTKDHITEIRPEIIETFPMVVYTSDQSDKEYLDNKPRASDSTITVDVFVKNATTTAIGQQIATIFNNLYWHCASNKESYDPDPMVRHRIMKFVKANLSDDLNYPKSSAKVMTAFSIVSPALTGTIDSTAGTITITCPVTTDVANLTASFSHTGQYVTIGSTQQIPGMTANDFTSPVTYVVVAEDATTKNYITTVNVGTFSNVGTSVSIGTSIRDMEILSGSLYVGFSIYLDGPLCYVYLSKYTAGTWSIQGDIFTDPTTLYWSFGINPSGIPYLVYQDGLDANKVKVKSYDGETWNTVGNPGYIINQICKISFDSSGVPYIAFITAIDSKISVMKYVGTTWTLVGSAGFASSTGLSFAIDSDDVPYILFIDSDNANKATVMKYTTTWEAVGTAGFTTDSISYEKIVFDSNNIPYIAFADFDQGNKITVMKYDSSWSVIGSAGFSNTSVIYISLDLDSNNRPYVAFVDATNVPKIMRFNDTIWKYIGPSNYFGETVWNLSMIINSDIIYTANNSRIVNGINVMQCV